MKKNTESDASKTEASPKERSSGMVIEACFAEETGAQCEQQIPIFIRFLANKERIWRPGKRNWDWRPPHNCQDDLAWTH